MKALIVMQTIEAPTTPIKSDTLAPAPAIGAYTDFRQYLKDDLIDLVWLKN